MAPYVAIRGFLPRRYLCAAGVCAAALVASRAAADWQSSDRQILEAINSGVGSIIDNVTPLQYIQTDLYQIHTLLDDFLVNFGYDAMGGGTSFFNHMIRVVTRLDDLYSLAVTNESSVSHIKTNVGNIASDTQSMSGSLNDIANNVRAIYNCQGEPGLTRRAFYADMSRSLTNLQHTTAQQTTLISNLIYQISPLGGNDNEYPTDTYTAFWSAYLDKEQPWVWNSSYPTFTSLLAYLPWQTRLQKDDYYYFKDYWQSPFVGSGTLFENYGEKYYQYYGNWWAESLTNLLSELSHQSSPTNDPLGTKEQDQRASETNLLEQASENQKKDKEVDDIVYTNDLRQAEADNVMSNASLEIAAMSGTNEISEVMQIVKDLQNVHLGAVDMRDVPTIWQNFWAGSGENADLTYAFSLNLANKTTTVAETGLLAQHANFLRQNVRPIGTKILNIFIWLGRVLFIVLCLRASMKAVKTVLE